MTIQDLLKEGRTIWGDKPMTLEHITVAMGVVYGDVCRQARAKIERGEVDDQELQKELGNLLMSIVRWCNDLGYDPEKCIALARQSQLKYAEQLPKN